MTVTIPTDYSKRIKLIRFRLGMTQVELAKRLGVSFATVNRWENAQCEPSALSWNAIGRLNLEGTDGLWNRVGPDNNFDLDKRLHYRERLIALTARGVVEAYVHDGEWYIWDSDRQKLSDKVLAWTEFPHNLLKGEL